MLSHQTNPVGHVPAASRLSWLSTEPFARVHPVHPIAGLSSSPPFLFPSRGQKLLGKLCEQNKVLREQERLVQQLRAEKVRGGQLKWPSRDEPGCPGRTFVARKRHVLLSWAQLSRGVSELEMPWPCHGPRTCRVLMAC